MSHPDPHVLPNRTAIQIGEVWENPVPRERATIFELPHQNPERRAVAELRACVGGRVVGEHPHPTPAFGMDHLDHQAERLLDYKIGTTGPAVEASGRSR